MKYKENLLRAWKKQKPEWTPIAAGLPYLDWEKFGYDENELEKICMEHKILFPAYKEGNLKRNHLAVYENFPDLIADRPYTDAWGSVWTTVHTGMVGAVTYHPLESWENLKGFKAPNPEITDGVRSIDWKGLQQSSKLAKENDDIFACGLPHGHTFLRAQDLRGYTNFILDMCDEEPLIDDLLDIICSFNAELINRFIALKPDFITIAEDLGMQFSPMISPEEFGRYIAPRYNKITKPIKEAGILVHEHSDGFILPLVDDIIKTGGDVLNLQDLVNGIDNISREIKPRISIDLDIDRQDITVNGSVKDVDDHIKECILKLGSREGGLSLTYQPWPPTPINNLDAAFTAMEKYAVIDYIHK